MATGQHIGGSRVRLPYTPLRELLAGDVVVAAAGLIGCVLARRMPGGTIKRALIVEAEAYHMKEPGCHAYHGKTPRNTVMFGKPGRLYVYFTYGMWHCCNVVCEPQGTAAAVLLRAAEPLGSDDRLSGPGLLCQGLNITTDQNGVNLFSRRGELWLYRPSGYTPPPLTWTTRVGFSFQDTLPWRCFWTGHSAVGKVSLKPLKRK